MLVTFSVFVRSSPEAHPDGHWVFSGECQPISSAFCEWVGAAPPSALCACLGMSWGDPYIALYISILSSHKQTFYLKNCSKVTLDVSDRTLAVE